MKNKLLIIAIIFILFSCNSKSITKTINYQSEIPAPVIGASPVIEDEIITSPAENIRRYTLNFLAAGDNLLHDSVYLPYMVNGYFDFSSLYTEVKSIVERADIAFINQETVMAGAGYGYSGYPLFNVPQAVAGVLADTGFDVVNLANNHAMDMGRNGLYATLDYLDTIDELTVIGARKQGESARLVTKNNITLGFLSYAHSLNGIALPSDNPNLVSMINRTRMEREITDLRPLCDFLIVSVHWGDEYTLQPVNSQVELARFIAGLNVDLIIGHHPHVLQKVETITLENGKQTLCYYSLGNFMSHQRERERIIGGLAAVVFSKTESDLNPAQLSILNYGIIPVITHYDRGFRNTKSYPLYLYTDELLQNHALRNAGSGLTMDFFNSVLERLNTNIIMRNPF